MDILVLGGTRFLGRHIVEAAREHGHKVTLFNRGVSNPELFPDLEKIHGNRAEDLDLFGSRKWDAVIDTSGYVPRVVRKSVMKLQNLADHYTFISSISVYANPSQPNLTEESPLEKPPDGVESEDIEQYYGALKVLCEDEVTTGFGYSALIVRAGLIVGPHDPTDRFTYWPWRIDIGGDVLVPGQPGWKTQFIDARDLADWIIRLIEKGQGGTFNATGPEQPLPIERLLEICEKVSGTDAGITWVSEDFLLKNNIQPWMELPLWLPGESHQGLQSASIEQALAQGLAFRSLESTVRDTLVWARSRPPEYQWRAGMPLDKEAELLHQWHTRTEVSGQVEE